MLADEKGPHNWNQVVVKFTLMPIHLFGKEAVLISKYFHLKPYWKKRLLSKITAFILTIVHLKTQFLCVFYMIRNNEFRFSKESIAYFISMVFLNMRRGKNIVRYTS